MPNILILIITSLICNISIYIFTNPVHFMQRFTMKTTKKLDIDLARDVIQNVESFLFDCDGVLWHETNAIPGCSETMHKLKNMGKRIFYITNNSTKTRTQLVQKCRKLGFPAEEDNIVCTANITAMYLKNIGFKGKLYMIGNPAMAYELDQAGISYTGLGPDPVNSETAFDDVLKWSHEWQQDPEVSGVLVGFDPHHNYKKMLKAATYAKNKNNLFLATDEDPFLPVAGDICMPGTGSIVMSVKYPCRRDPVVIGKPSTTMFDVLHKTHGLEASKTMIVGDCLMTDIAMGGHCGLRSLLVLTGVNDVKLVEDCQKSSDPEMQNHIPEMYTDCFADLGSYMDRI